METIRRKLVSLASVKNRRDYVRLSILDRATPFRPGHIVLLGRRIEYSHPQSLAAQYRDIFMGRSYDFDASRPDPVIVDCGANIGMASLFWKLKYPAARVTCFEPDPTLYDKLRANLRSFGFHDVNARRAAVWTSSGTMGFHVQGAGGGHLGGELQVQTVRLRDYLMDRLDQTRIDLLKVDIEGAEVDVLEDIADHLNVIDRVFVEYHAIGREKSRIGALLKLLEDAGFLLSLRHELAPQTPFLVRNAPQSDMWMQVNIWAWRLA